MTKSQEILLAIPEGDRNMAALNMHRYVNMVGGRHSDAARMEVREYESMGAEKYRENFHAQRA